MLGNRDTKVGSFSQETDIYITIVCNSIYINLDSVQFQFNYLFILQTLYLNP